MPVTLSDLVIDTETHLYAFGESRDKVTHLSADITSGATTVTVANGQMVSRGLIEIDNELLAVSAVDTASGTVTIHPWGRAQGGSTAAAHSANARVASNPRFPRARIIREINDTIVALYPTLYAVTVESLGNYIPWTYKYALPTGADGVITLQWQDSYDYWLFIDRFRVESNADGTRYVALDWPVPSGRPMQAIVRKKLTPLTATTDALTSSGCQDSWRDLIVTKALANMVRSMDFARLQLDSAESSSRADKTPPMSAASVVRNLMAMYQMRLQQERRLLQQRYPTRLVRAE